MQAVADSTPLLVAGTIEVVLLTAIFQILSHRLTITTGVEGGVPDGWFGAPADRLYGYLEALGPDGRRAYASINLMDFFPMMPSYAIVLGAWLVRSCRSAGVTTARLAWIFPLVAVFDVVESSVFGYANARYPDRLDPSLLSLASVANGLKWVCLTVGLVSLAALFVRNSFGARKRHRL